MPVANKTEVEANHGSVLPAGHFRASAGGIIVKHTAVSMLRTTEPELPEATTKIYVYCGSALVGQEVSRIERDFRVGIQVLSTTSADRIIEGSEFRVSGNASSVESFLKRFF